MADKSDRVTYYNKLVRDRIPDIIRAAGDRCVVNVLTPEGVVPVLKQKLLEEAKEVLKAEGKTETFVELADVLEVVYSLLNELGGEAAEVEVEMIRLRRRQERGGFDNRMFLVSTEKPAAESGE